MKKPKFGPLFLALAIFAVVLIIFMFNVNNYLNQITHVDGLAPVIDPDKFQGLLIEKKTLANHDCLFILDSSDLENTDYPSHPSNVFNGRPTGFIPYLIGRGGTLSIIHFLNIAALNRSLANQKVVYMPGPTWFKPGGIEDYNFTMNFSPLQAYKFVFNSDISPGLKAKVARRMLKFSRTYWDPVLTALVYGLTDNNWIHRGVSFIVRPLGHVFLAFWEQYDHFVAYKLIIKYNQIPQQITRRNSVDWQNLLSNAINDGEKACRNNPFSIDDKHFNMFKKQLKTARNHDIHSSFSKSIEYGDLQLLFSLFKELKIKPLIIIQPFNGFWYDYTGFPIKERTQYYQNLKQIAKTYGFPYVDLSEHEHDMYFMHDTKHIGWKGWVYIDQELDRFYHQ
jgi:D-alanine transfer protein